MRRWWRSRVASTLRTSILLCRTICARRTSVRPRPCLLRSVLSAAQALTNTKMAYAQHLFNHAIVAGEFRTAPDMDSVATSAAAIAQVRAAAGRAHAAMAAGVEAADASAAVALAAAGPPAIPPPPRNVTDEELSSQHALAEQFQVAPAAVVAGADVEMLDAAVAAPAAAPAVAARSAAVVPAPAAAAAGATAAAAAGVAVPPAGALPGTSAQAQTHAAVDLGAFQPRSCPATLRPAMMSLCTCLAERLSQSTDAEHFR